MTAVPEPWPTGRHRPARPRAVRPPVLRSPAPRPAPPPVDLSAPRPRVVDDPGVFGLSRLSRSRMGSRLFTAFFVFVFGSIFLQLVASLLYPTYP